jgi:hypothetical protein
MYGPDTRNWVGKSITLVAAEVDFKGDLVSALRVKVTSKQPAAPQEPPPFDDDPEL